MTDGGEIIVTETVTPAAGLADALARVNETAAAFEEQAHFAMNRIAEGNYNPLVDRPWAGQQDVLASLRAEYPDLDEQRCNEIVTCAVTQLHATTKETFTHIERRKLLLRYNGYRQIVLAAVNEPRTTEIWKFKIKRDKSKQPVLDAQGRVQATSIPVKKTIAKGKDIAALRLLIEIEEKIAGLHRLDEPDGDVTAEIFQTFDRGDDGRPAGGKVMVSISERHKTRNLNDLKGRGRELIEQAVRESRGRKSVDATVLVETADDGASLPGGVGIPGDGETGDPPDRMGDPVEPPPRR